MERISRLAPLAALGFLLLIPLQANARWTLIRTADIVAQKTIRSAEHKIATLRSAKSKEELLHSAKGLPLDLQPLPTESVDGNRLRLLGKVEPELGRLKMMATDRKSIAIQAALLESSRDLLIFLVYAWSFWGLRTRQSDLHLWAEADLERISSTEDRSNSNSSQSWL